MPEMVFDSGNARWKYFVPRRNRHGDFRHAIAQLEESDWKKIAGRQSTPPAGFAKVNNTPYAFGDAARRYTISERPVGAARYKRTYYGPPLGFVLAEAFEKSVPNLVLVASHAPGDINYAKNLIESAKGEWYVFSRMGDLYFNIQDVLTFDEPLGGYCHFALTEEGKERKRNPLRDAMVLVVDVGGHTVDVVKIDPGGEVDMLSLKSTRDGILKMTAEFEDMLRTNNATIFQDAHDLDIRRVETALLSGVYKVGKVAVDCKNEASAAMTSLVNDVVDIINRAGGAHNFDYVLLTGGGAAMLYHWLVAALPRAEFLLAEENVELMRFANVFGGAKLTAMMQRNGEW